MAHTIEIAKSGRSRCRTCKRAIAKGDLRVSEEFVSAYTQEIEARFHHLSCAAGSQPYVLKQALESTDVEVPDRAELEARIERALSVTDVAAEDEGQKLEYARFVEDVTKDPTDAHRLTVFADWLQSVEDPRGELIVIQQEIETASRDERERLLQKESKLLATHRRRLVPEVLGGKIAWRRGFVHRLEIRDATGLVVETLERSFGHPSLCLLAELAVKLAWEDITVSANLPPLPKTLRALELGDHVSLHLGAVAEMLRPLPHLERLRIAATADLEHISHESVTTLEIHLDDGRVPRAHFPGEPPLALMDRVRAMKHRSVPKLSRLSLHVERELDHVCLALEETDVLDHLETLELAGDFGTEAAMRLAQRIREPLGTIDVRACPRLTTFAVEALLPRARSVLARGIEAKPEGGQRSEGLVRHTKRPEWGVGRVVEELDDGGLVVEFESAGKKTIRGVELLEDVAG